MEDKNLVEQGFTLVELLIVVVILGILAGIVVFAVGNLTDTAKGAGCATEADSFKTAVAVYQAQNSGNLPAGATTAAVATNLGNLLSSTSFKFEVTGHPTAPNWSYATGTGLVTKGTGPPACS